jgi:signal transduction histidine kinase
VICDIMMPGTDGFGVLEALRSNDATALTPFIFLTAKAGGKDVRLGMNEGADDYITKPFDPDALLASARQRLSRRRAQLAEAERRATDTGMLAAAALPREMESCLAHLESLAEALAARSHGDPQTNEIGTSLKTEIDRLRILSRRLRLYGELPSLYARRFFAASANASCSVEIAINAARRAAALWNRAGSLDISASEAVLPLAPEAVEVIVTELVDNACKFSPATAPIGVEVSRERTCWKLAVADGGQGMTARHVREIGAFKQFWNGAERPRGLGIGLVLVQALVRLFGGEVQIESEPNGGTRVSVMAPLE